VLGVSFTELLLVGMIALVVVGPSRLPKLLGTLGRWSAKLRRITTEVRNQSGIDELLRKEGISGLNELRQLRNTARTGLTGLLAPGAATPARPGARPAAAGSAATASTEDPYADVPYDRTREYPVEGCDAAGALPDDLWRDPARPATAAAAAPPVVAPAPATTGTETAPVAPPAAGPAAVPPETTA
jgi:sec-independent protein translocase protein TatB